MTAPSLRSPLRVCLPALLLLVASPLCAQPNPEKPQTPQIAKVKALSGFKDWATSVAFSPDGKWLAAGSYDIVEIWSTADWKSVATLKPRTGYANDLLFTPDSSTLIVPGYQKITLWSMETFKRTTTLRGHRGYVTDLDLSPDGTRLASSSEDFTVRIWDLQTEETVLTLEAPELQFQGVAFSPTEDLLATVSGDINRVTQPGPVKLWNLKTGEFVHEFPEHLRVANSILFSPDGHLLITTSEDEKVNIYDVPNRKAHGFYAGHSRPTNDALLAQDGRTVISCSGGRAKGKNEIKLWDREDGREWGGFEAHKEKINAVALSPSGTLLATASHDQTVIVWDIKDALKFIHKELGIEVPPEEISPPKREPIEAPQPQLQFKVDDPIPPQNGGAEKRELRVGIIGLDTSHVIAFTQLLNDPQKKDDLAGCRVVAAYPQGSADIESSASRIPKYTEQMKDMGIEIVDSIPALLEKVDVVLLETNDGRLHLEQVLPILQAGKRVFIDKPLAASLVDVVAIYKAAEQYEVPLWSSSSLRFMSSAQAVRDGKIGKVLGCNAYSPCSLEKTHPDLFWYGIHGVEILYTVMGPGCETVTRASTPDFEFVTGVWSEGRIGTFRGIRKGASGYGGTAFGEKGIQQLGPYEGYRGLVVEIVKYFHTGKPPVSAEETIELHAFMVAADESKRLGGVPVKVQEVLDQATAQAEEKLKAMKLDAAE